MKAEHSQSSNTTLYILNSKWFSTYNIIILALELYVHMTIQNIPCDDNIRSWSFVFNSPVYEHVEFSTPLNGKSVCIGAYNVHQYTSVHNWLPTRYTYVIHDALTYVWYWLFCTIDNGICQYINPVWWPHFFCHTTKSSQKWPHPFHPFSVTQTKPIQVSGSWLNPICNKKNWQAAGIINFIVPDIATCVHNNGKLGLPTWRIH